MLLVCDVQGLINDMGLYTGSFKIQKKNVYEIDKILNKSCRTSSEEQFP